MLVTFVIGAGEGHYHKTPIVTVIVGIYPLSFYSAGDGNVYPLQNDHPLPTGGLHWCVPLGLCGKLLSSPSYLHDATSGLCTFLPICPSLPFSVRQGSKEGCSLYSSGRAFESPCYLTASPPIPLPTSGPSAINIYGGGAVNSYVRSVPNCLPSLLAIPTLYGNLGGVYSTFRMRVPHVYSATRAHSAPQDCNVTVCVNLHIPWHTQCLIVASKQCTHCTNQTVDSHRLPILVHIPLLSGRALKNTTSCSTKHTTDRTRSGET